MKILKHKPFNSQIYAEAGEWLVEFRSGDADAQTRKDFYSWLRTSPEHMRAYLELAAIWDEGGELDPEREFDDVRLARESQEQGNVIAAPMRSSREDSQASPGRSGRGGLRRHAFALAASLAIAAVALGAWAYLKHGVYTTGIGEQRAFTLSDGSRIELNSRSAVQVRFTDTARSIELVQGQALFRVAQDKTRPLVVRSGDTQVRAIGTQFDVYRSKAGTRVTVLEGKVAVTLAGAAVEISPQGSVPLLVGAGEQAVVTARSPVKTREPDISSATAWTQGRLVFKATPLRDVADEFNRYNEKPLVVRDAQLSEFKVTGSFSSTDPTSLILFLESRPGITVTREQSQIVVTRR